MPNKRAKILSLINSLVLFISVSYCVLISACKAKNEHFENKDSTSFSFLSFFDENIFTGSKNQSNKKTLVPKKCITKGHERKNPASFQIINRDDPECAFVANAIKKREEAELQLHLNTHSKKRATVNKYNFEVITRVEEPTTTNPASPPPNIQVFQTERKGFPTFDGKLLEAFSGEDQNIFYIVTRKYIYVMKTPHKVLRKIKKAGYVVRDVSPTGVSRTEDSKWIWYSYFTADEIPDGTKEPEYFARTNIYRKNGELWWILDGIVSTVSHDGKKAVIVYPEHSGMGYIKKHEQEAEIVDLTGVDGPASACIYDDGMTIVHGISESSITTLDSDLNITKTQNVLGSCRMNLCLASEGLCLVECCDYNKDVSILYTLDSHGAVIQKNPFFTWGKRIHSIDWNTRRLLLGVFTGESYIINIDRGKVEGRMGRLRGLEKAMPHRKFRGSRREYLQYASRIQKRNKEKYLVHRAFLFGNSIVRLRSPQDKRENKNKTALLEIVDFSGNRLLRKDLNDMIASPPGFDSRLPLAWSSGNYVNVLLEESILKIGTERRSR
jgi:hypothetical protein